MDTSLLLCKTPNDADSMDLLRKRAASNVTALAKMLDSISRAMRNGTNQAEGLRGLTRTLIFPNCTSNYFLVAGIDHHSQKDREKYPNN